MQTLKQAKKAKRKAQQDIAILEALNKYRKQILAQGIDKDKVNLAYRETIRWLERYEEHY